MPIKLVKTDGSISFKSNGIPMSKYNEEIAAKEAEYKGTIESLEAEVEELEEKYADCNGLHIDESALVISGNCNRCLAGNHFNWLVEQYGNLITTENLGDTESMFYMSNKLESIPFDFNFEKETSTYGYKPLQHMFYYCEDLREITGKIINPYPANLKQMFCNCYNLRYLPEFVNVNWSRIHEYTYAYMQGMFNSCYSLREIPEDFLKEIYSTKMTSSSYVVMNECFGYCRNLDEVRGLSPITGKLTSNAFSSTFAYCCRLKDMIFDTQEDGTPYTAQWKSQTIDLSQYVGYYPNVGQTWMYIRDDYNSGIVQEDNEVYDDETYQARKDSKDWFTYADLSDGIGHYSRYNHDSAVRTINSLPDTSVFLAENGGVNTIKFKGNQGGKTDGGAINTLTAEEVAIATQKGWTITFVD